MGSSDIEILDCKCCVNHFEIPATLYDRTGYFAFWNIPRLYQNTEFYTTRSGFMDNHIFPGFFGTSVNIRETIHFFPDVLRKITRSQRLHYSMTKEFVGAGNSTNTIKACIIIDETGELLCEKYVKALNLDLKTRRPMVYPPWFREKYSQQMEGLNLEKAPLLKPPRHCFRTKANVRYSDIDQNGHMTSEIYYRFIMDCATAASQSGYYKYYSQDMAWFPVLKADLSYFKECMANEIIDIYTWQQDYENIYFVFHVRNKCVFQASLTFDTVPYEIDVGSQL